MYRAVDDLKRAAELDALAAAVGDPRLKSLYLEMARCRRLLASHPLGAVTAAAGCPPEAFGPSYHLADLW